MPDETSTPPDSTSSPQAADTQTPPSEPEQFSSENLTDKPVSAPVTEPTPPPEAASPAPEPESLSQSETETGKPNTPTTPSVEADTPPQAGGEETPAQAEVSEAVSESTSEPSPSAQGSGGTQQSQPEPVQANPPAPQTEPPPFAKEELKNTGIIAELLTKARAKIQDRRRKKLEKIMQKVTETGKISNNEVQKLLRVSDATATRYLQALEKENKIKQTGKTGMAVFYEKM